jgi:hypothetical protein
MKSPAAYISIGLCSILVFYLSAAHCFADDMWLFNGDPTYAYLFNGLNVATLHTVGHVDHPGTILQIAVAGLLRLDYLFAPEHHSENIVHSVLFNPEWYLKRLYLSFYTIQSAVLAAVGVCVWRQFRNGAVLVAVLAGLFASPRIILTQAYLLRPEILVPSLQLILALAALTRWREDALSPSPGAVPSRRLAMGTGALAGLALFNKVTCFPVFAVSFFFWKDRKGRLTWLAGLAGVALCCLPFIYKSAEYIRRWFWGLASRDGRYGEGSARVLSPEYFKSNLAKIAAENWLSAGLLAICLLGLMFYWERRQTLGWKIVALSAAAAAFIALLAAKHYAPHYLLAMHMPVFLIPALWAASRENKWPRRLIATACLSTGMAFAWQTQKYVVNKAKHNYPYRIQAEYSQSWAQGRNIVESFNTYTIPYAMSFGCGYANNRYSDLLQAIYPHYYQYHVWLKKFEHFGRRVSFEEAVGGKPTIIRGTFYLIRPFSGHLVLGEKLASFNRDTAHELLGVEGGTIYKTDKR